MKVRTPKILLLTLNCRNKSRSNRKISVLGSRVTCLCHITMLSVNRFLCNLAVRLFEKPFKRCTPLLPSRLLFSLNLAMFQFLFMPLHISFTLSRDHQSESAEQRHSGVTLHVRSLFIHVTSKDVLTILPGFLASSS